MTQMTIEQAIALAKGEHQRGRLREAESIYQQVLAAYPNQPDALHMIAMIAFQQQRYDAALSQIDRAISLQPDAATFHANRALILRAMEQHELALKSLQRAVELAPQSADVRNRLANLYRELGDFENAIAEFDQAIARQPDFLEAIVGKAEAQQQSNDFVSAVETYRKALSIRRDLHEVHNNLGVALLHSNHPEEAIAAFQSALSIRGQFPEAQLNLGDALRSLQRFEDAESAYQKAANLRPEWWEPAFNIGWLKMLAGDYERGWPLLESRWRDPEIARFRSAYTQPAWQGQPTPNATLLIYTEQGFGDAIQFVRYVQQVRKRIGKIICACPTELLTLFRSVGGIDEFITTGSMIPAHDLNCSLASLPMIFKSTPDTIPRNVPYLHADTAKSNSWAERLRSVPGLKVGLAWAGRATHRQDRSRSIPLSMLNPLADAAGVSLINLQFGSAAQQINNPANSLSLIDWTNELSDFSDTAALIDQLDLVICVDTAVAHLAGALGKKIWLLLPFVPDWRWLLGRDDSPWYPTMQLFRQTQPGDWSEPIARLTDALRQEGAR